jgi:hypothetical protein
VVWPVRLIGGCDVLMLGATVFLGLAVVRYKLKGLYRE